MNRFKHFEGVVGKTRAGSSPAFGTTKKPGMFIKKYRALKLDLLLSVTPSFMKPLYKKIHFYMVKLPFIYLAIPIGFIFEYLITFPYLILCAIDSFSQKKTTITPPESDIP
jgi:hypothetical protein